MRLLRLYSPAIVLAFMAAGEAVGVGRMHGLLLAVLAGAVWLHVKEELGDRPTSKTAIARPARLESTWRKFIRQNAYRDLWLLAITGLVWFSLQAQSSDRKSAVNANVQARYHDCLSGNDLRRALRKGLETNRVERPFLLKLLPQFNTPQVLALIERGEREQLAGFAPRNCVEYAQESLPGHRTRYTLRISQ